MANNCTPNIQAVLNQLYSLGRYTAPAGALEMALSDANGAAVDARLIQKNGKNSQYSITYAKGSCDTPVECDDFVCDGVGTDSGALTECLTFNSFNCMSMPAWKNIQINTLRDLGSLDATSAFAAHLWDQMQKIKAAVDTAYITFLCTEAGCFSTGVDVKTLNLLNALGAPNFSVDGSIMSDFADGGFGGVTPILLGNRQVKQFAMSQGASGMADSGLNLGSMTRFPAFYDKNITSANCAPLVPGNEVMFALLPGVANILSWSENSGIFASRQNQVNWDSVDPTSLIQSDSTYLHTTLQDPTSGMLFDLNVVYEPKCKQFQYHLKAYYKFLNLPVTGCVDSCFNGIVKYDVCPEAAPACATPPPGGG